MENSQRQRLRHHGLGSHRGRSAFVAHEVDDPPRAELWARFVAMYDGLEVYQRQAERRFPVVALRPGPT